MEKPKVEEAPVQPEPPVLKENHSSFGNSYLDETSVNEI